jgi:hypothetical protein
MSLTDRGKIFATPLAPKSSPNIALLSIYFGKKQRWGDSMMTEDHHINMFEGIFKWMLEDLVRAENYERSSAQDPRWRRPCLKPEIIFRCI